MALRSKSDFAKLCGVNSGDLSNYIKRKKVKVRKDLRIDDTNPVNRLFLKNILAKRKVKAQPVIETPLNEEEESTKDELVEILKTKGDLDLQQRRNNIILQTIDIQKKQGEVIPTPAVRSLILHHSESIKTAYAEASDNLLIIIAQKAQLSSTDLADVRVKFLKLINKAIDTSIETSKKTLHTIVKEYSTKRGVGQHD